MVTGWLESVSNGSLHSVDWRAGLEYWSGPLDADTIPCTMVHHVVMSPIVYVIKISMIR